MEFIFLRFCTQYLEMQYCGNQGEIGKLLSEETTEHE